MKTYLKPLAAVLAALFVLLAFGGCATQPEDENSIPWSRPAGWEGQIPGMGTTPGSGTR